MTAPLPRRATDPSAQDSQSAIAVARGTTPQLDYLKVREYWKRARPSMLGPYMMDGFGFPAGAGRFRFRGELHAVAETIRDLRPDISVLDLGCGVGVWTEYFAQRFAKVVAVEASSTLCEVLRERCSRYPNVTTYHGNVLSFEPKGKFGPSGGFGPTGGFGSTGGFTPTGGFGLVFLGGLLMYLEDRDVATLLRELIPYLEPGALVLCRESTIRRGINTLQGEYQVVYRSVETYRNLLGDAGFDVVSVRANTAYINLQMACELIKKWKALVPDRFRCLPVVGRLAYWGLRLGYPWNTRLIPWLLARMGRGFPMLTNHFFVLRPSLQATANRLDTPLHGPRIEEERFENAR